MTVIQSSISEFFNNLMMGLIPAIVVMLIIAVIVFIIMCIFHYIFLKLFNINMFKEEEVKCPHCNKIINNRKPNKIKKN